MDTSPKTFRWISFSAIPLGVGVFVATVGLMVVLGWVLGVPALTSINPGWVTMKFNTAVCFILAGVALAGLGGAKPSVLGRYLGRVCAGLVLAVALLTLTEYLFGLELGIDQGLFHLVRAVEGASNPGRMSAGTAFCFLLVGGALLITEAKRSGLRLPVIAALAVAVIVIGGLALTGYAAEALRRQQWWDYTGMAAQSATGFFVVGLALLAFVKTQGGVVWRLDRIVTAGFALAIAVMLIATAITHNFINKQEDASMWVAHTQEVLKAIEGTAANMADLESARHFYIITGTEQADDGRDETQTAIQQGMANLRKLTRDNPRQQRRLDELQPLFIQWLGVGEQVAQVRRQQGFAAAQELMAAGPARGLSEKIEQLLSAMEAEEYTLLGQRQKDSTLASSATFLVLPLGVFLSLTMLSVGLFLLNASVSERKQVEVQARQLAAIVESSDDAIIGKNLQGIVTSWNLGAERVFGYTAAEMVGRPIAQLIPVDRFLEEAEILGRIQQGKSLRHFETVRIKKGGELMDISVTVSPIRDGQGQVIGASKVARDVTERKRAEARLRDSIKEVNDLKAALDEHAIVATTDPQGRITYVNDKFCTISKYARQELLGQDHRLINSGHHSKEFIRGIWATIGQGRVWQGEIKNKAKDGTVYWVDTTIVPFLNEEGKPRQYVAIRADITERKRAEEALRASEARYHTLFEHAPDGILIADVKSNYLDANASALRMLGYTREELIGMNAASIVSQLEIAQIEVALDTIKAKSNYHREWKFRRKDGSIFDADVIATMMADGNLMGMVRDVTERKKAEEKINELNLSLEQRVVERTIQLEAANKELEAFSYSVSHDLRAPLRAVDGFSQAVEEDYAAMLPEEGRRYLKTIREGAQRMGLLIDDLLAFSRLSRQPLTRRPVNMGKLARDIVAELNSQNEGRKIEVRAGELPAGEGDAALLKQVWVNLLSNAFKYTRKREHAVIEIGCLRESAANVYFVRDNGTGFDMQYAPKLFGVFQRLHRAEDYEGTGVGLAIVQRIIHRHGGRIWADAKLEGGATFYFTLNEKAKS